MGNFIAKVTGPYLLKPKGWGPALVYIDNNVIKDYDIHEELNIVGDKYDYESAYRGIKNQITNILQEDYGISFSLWFKNYGDSFKLEFDAFMASSPPLPPVVTTTTSTSTTTIAPTTTTSAAPTEDTSNAVSSDDINTSTTTQNPVDVNSLAANNTENITNLLKTGDTIAQDQSAEGMKAGVDESNSMDKGVTYPIIRINDHYFSPEEIEEFYLECGYIKSYTDYKYHKKPMHGFVPTFYLHVNTCAPELIKDNIIKCGDKAAIFFSSGHGMIKSLRCDCIITNAITREITQEFNDPYIEYFIMGELYVPDLRTEAESFAYNGTSRNAMMEAAKRLKLSYMFCDPDDTDDTMIWQCNSTLEEYAKEVTMHAWKNFNSFFDAWIDPHYALSFLNINKLLKEDGLEPKIDLTIFTDYLNSNRASEGKKAHLTENQTKESVRPLAKILTNIGEEDSLLTPYFVKEFSITNNAAEILNQIGLNSSLSFVVDNPGCENGATEIEMKYSMPINETKLKNGYYILVGPGRNLTYTSGDEASATSYVEKSFSKSAAVITETMSTGDELSLAETGGNMQASGNTHKFYDVAYQHNVRNNLLLQKLIVHMTLAGANLTLVRGEKIPAIIIDNNKLNSFARAETVSGTKLAGVIMENVSGWFIIDGIKWKWSRKENSPSSNLTCWETYVNLTRREWPIPGGTYTIIDDDGNQIAIDNGKGTSIDGMNVVTVGSEEDIDMAVTSASGAKEATDTNEHNKSTQIDIIKGLAQLDGVSITQPIETLIQSGPIDLNIFTSNIPNAQAKIEQDNPSSLLVYNYLKNINESSGGNSNSAPAISEVPLTGLRTYMLVLYEALNIIAKDKFKLVSAKRWAVDYDGTRVEGNAFIKKYGFYKCVNAKGEVMYFKSNNSRHLYGEAIDIINANGQDFNTLMTDIIMQNPAILLIMYRYGLSAYIEQAKDDAGVTSKHYHIGTDTTKQKQFWASVKAILGGTTIPGTNIDFSNYKSNNIHQTLEITHDDIDENSVVSKSEQ